MKLSKLSIPYRAGQTLLTLLFFAFFTGVDIARFDLTAAAVILSGLLVWITGVSVWVYLVWKKFEFEITEDTFDIRSGVLNRRKREIPLKRIQNVDIRRNIVQRMLGIAKVNIETAGGKSTEASLKYVNFDEAKRIQKRVRELKQEVQEKEGEEDVEPVFEITNRELSILSLTSVSGKALAAAFLILSLSGAFFREIQASTGTSGFTIALLSFIGVGIFSVAGSIATKFSRCYGFKLFQRSESLEYERGLVNRSEGSIPLEKIQVVSMHENPLKRFLGYATLKIETAGYGPGNQENTGAEVAVPLGKKSHIKQLSNSILGHKDAQIQKISDKALRRYFGRYILTSITFTGLLLLTTSLTDFYVNPVYLLVLIPVSALAAYLKYVNRGFYEGERFFHTMTGFWDRKTNVVPYYRIQTLIEERTFFQRRLGLSSLVIDTAGVSVFGSNPKVCDIDLEVSENLFGRVHRRFQNSKKN
jgi:putative membrane protein